MRACISWACTSQACQRYCGLQNKRIGSKFCQLTVPKFLPNRPVLRRAKSLERQPGPFNAFGGFGIYFVLAMSAQNLVGSSGLRSPKKHLRWTVTSAAQVGYHPKLRVGLVAASRLARFQALTRNIGAWRFIIGGTR